MMGHDTSIQDLAESIEALGNMVASELFASERRTKAYIDQQFDARLGLMATFVNTQLDLKFDAFINNMTTEFANLRSEITDVRSDLGRRIEKLAAR